MGMKAKNILLIVALLFFVVGGLVFVNGKSLTGFAGIEMEKVFPPEQVEASNLINQRFINIGVPIMLLDKQ